MKIATPLTKERLKTHITYSTWKYVLLVVAAVFGWNLLYTTTAYRSPQNLRIDVYIKSSTASQEMADEFMRPVWQETVPEMEIVQSVIMASTGEDYYSAMQLSVYIMANEGDIYILGADDFKSYAAQGAFMPLEELVETGVIDATDIDLSSGYVAMQPDEDMPYETHLYGIPADTLYGYMNGFYLDNRGMYLAIALGNGNDDNVIPFLDGLVQAGRAEKPDFIE